VHEEDASTFKIIGAKEEARLATIGAYLIELRQVVAGSWILVADRRSCPGERGSGRADNWFSRAFEKGRDPRLDQPGALRGHPAEAFQHFSRGSRLSADARIARQTISSGTGLTRSARRWA